MIVTIDPGHGGDDPGCRGEDPRGGDALVVRESDVNLALARELRHLLAERGHSAVLTRVGDNELSLTDRASAADGAHCLVSIHHNAAPSPWGRGFEVLVDQESSAIDPAGGGTRPLAECLITRARPVLDQWGIPVRNPAIKEDEDYAAKGHLTLLEAAKVPAVIVEVCFLTNPLECLAATLPQFRAGVAAALAAGVEVFGREVQHVQ